MRKRIIVKTDLDQPISEFAAQVDHKTLAAWGCDCAERVLPFFEAVYPEDKRPRLALEAARTWIETGVFKMSVIRGASLASHASARQAEADENLAARAAARAAGQAVAAAHSARHAIAAALYAASAIRDAVEASESEASVAKERDWQYQHLKDLKERFERYK